MQLTVTPGTHIDLSVEIQELAKAYHSVMMDAGELLVLASTLAMYPWQPEAIVVEIGTYVGQTAVFMAKVLQLLGQRIPILSIDPFERVQADPLNPQGIYAAYLENIRSNNLDDMCMPLVAFSQDAAPVVPANIGVLVVDGAHHYPVVRKDLELYAPKVLPNGFIFVDDYGPAYPDVIRAVDEYFDSGCPFTILHKTYFVVAQRIP
jgi:hypothetical protein